MAPSTPSPPARESAAATSGDGVKPTMGSSMPSSSQIRVRMVDKGLLVNPGVGRASGAGQGTKDDARSFRVMHRERADPGLRRRVDLDAVTREHGVEHELELLVRE